MCVVVGLIIVQASVLLRNKQKKKSHRGGNTCWVRVRTKNCVCFVFFPGGVLIVFFVSGHV